MEFNTYLHDLYDLRINADYALTHPSFDPDIAKISAQRSIEIARKALEVMIYLQPKAR